MAQIEMTDQWVRNFKAALASFIQEEMPVTDPHTDVRNDQAWAMADRLTGPFISEFSRLPPEVPHA